ncbi:hypothetical protein HPP92_017389 [Vanilla planifolia]|uniref:Uncharacterized protein n=1 Tax=Vanilla planifolia TaxID=51239 RepID=A0A835QE01_VANPL|nr:hypothetical protein HPP92_017389 [Vanilla planifolia]
MVADLLDKNGCWNVEHLWEHFVEDLIHRILHYRQFSWEAFNALIWRKTELTLPNTNQRVKTLTWRMCRDTIPVKAWLS